MSEVPLWKCLNLLLNCEARLYPLSTVEALSALSMGHNEDTYIMLCYRRRELNDIK